MLDYTGKTYHTTQSMGREIFVRLLFARQTNTQKHAHTPDSACWYRHKVDSRSPVSGTAWPSPLCSFPISAPNPAAAAAVPGLLSIVTGLTSQVKPKYPWCCIRTGMREKKLSRGPARFQTHDPDKSVTPKSHENSCRCVQAPGR